MVERASWRAGFYEIMNKAIKHSLRVGLGRFRLSLEEFATVLHEVAATINERPLTYVSTDPDQFPLRPVDLARLDIGSSCQPALELPDQHDPDYKPTREARDHLIEGYQKGIRKLDKFWDAWKSQYLVGLRERQRKLTEGGTNLEPAVGRVVLIEDEKLPRNAWRLGRITELIPGERGIRTAKLRVI